MGEAAEDKFLKERETGTRSYIQEAIVDGQMGSPFTRRVVKVGKAPCGKAAQKPNPEK